MQWIYLALVAISFFAFRKLFFYVFTDYNKTKNQQKKSDELEKQLQELKKNKIDNKEKINDLTKQQIELNLAFVDRTWIVSVVLMVIYMYIFSQLTFLDEFVLFGFQIPWFIAYLGFTFIISMIYDKITRWKYE